MSRNPFDPAASTSGNPFDPGDGRVIAAGYESSALTEASGPATATGEQLRHDLVMGGWPWADATRRILAIEAEARAAGLREATALEALREALAWIDANDDAMGHGYCATQSGDYTDACTCGFQEKRDRWGAALQEFPDDR